MGKLGFGIIGCGMIANWHASAIEEIEEAELRGVFGATKAETDAFAEKRGTVAYYNLDDLLKNDDINIVCICTPSGLHADLAINAANAKKHIVIEKPMAITKEQLDSIISACEANGVKATVISQLRFTDAIKKVKSAIDSGLLGKIFVANAHMKFYRSPEYYKKASWRGTWALDGGGALMNQGIHGIDMLTYLAGPVKSVYGVCKTLLHNIEVEDTAQMLVEFESGAMGTIEGTTSVNPGYPRIIEICGEKGSVALREDKIIRWDIAGSESQVDKTQSNHNSFNDPAAFSPEHHILQLRDFINAIKNNDKPLVDLYEGRRAVDIILAAYESNRLGKRVEL